MLLAKFSLLIGRPQNVRQVLKTTSFTWQQLHRLLCVATRHNRPLVKLFLSAGASWMAHNEPKSLHGWDEQHAATYLIAWTYANSCARGPTCADTCDPAGTIRSSLAVKSPSYAMSRKTSAC